MEKPYFVYDQEAGFERFATEEEAKEAAEALISAYRKSALDFGWDESSDTVCWGIISEHVVMRKTGEKIYFEGEMVDGFDCSLES